MKNIGVAGPAAVLKLNDKQHRKNRGWREKPKEKKDINIEPCWQTAILPSLAKLPQPAIRAFPLFLPFLQRVALADVNVVILLLNERHCVFSYSIFCLPSHGAQNDFLLLF